MKQAQDNKCAISPNTFKRIYLLTIIGSFKQGAYGLKRLQKITYLSEVDSDIRPYLFRRHHYGQYSEELADINNSLIQLNYISHNLLPGSDCSVYSVPDDIDVTYYKHVLSLINPVLVERIQETIDEYGYLPEEKLIEWCYSRPEFRNKESGEIVLGDKMPEYFIVDGLTKEQCESLELAFSPDFVNSMSQIVDGLTNASIDLNKVEKVAFRI